MKKKNKRKEKMIKCNKIEQEEKDCIIALLQDYNGSWDNLKKEKRYREVIKYYKQKKGTNER
jgi:hypothetical protein